MASGLRPLDEVVAALEQKHAEDQDAIADDLAAALWVLWGLWDFNSLDVSGLRFIEASVPVVKTAYMQSQNVAAAFVQNVRFASLATADPIDIGVPVVELPNHVPAERFFAPATGITFEPVPVDPFPAEDVAVSLAVESNSKVKAATKLGGRAESDIIAAAQQNTEGAAVRQALKGARNVTNNVLKFDRKALGYARFTDGNPCYFCALLASRGAVYDKKSFLDTDKKFDRPKELPKVPQDYLHVAKVHNNCRCTLRPVYTKSSGMDAEAKFYLSQWTAAYKDNPDASPADMVSKFRDWYTPFVRSAPDLDPIDVSLDERREALLDSGFDEGSPQVLWTDSVRGVLAAG